jgi:hypothetical protein
MTVTDSWRALKYSVPQNSPHKHITIRDFVDILAGDILKMELDRRRSCDRGARPDGGECHKYYEYWGNSEAGEY